MGLDSPGNDGRGNEYWEGRSNKPYPPVKTLAKVLAIPMPFR